MAGKGVDLTENFMFQDNPRLFFTYVNVLQIKWLSDKRHHLKSFV